MRVLVYPHELGLGGSQLNAVELAAAVRDRGHDVAVYGRTGALVGRIRELGLRFIESPPPGRRPDGRVVADLRRLMAKEGIDVVHGYEWPSILEARLACVGTSRAVVGTVMSMAVPPFIPRDLHLVVGTRQIAAHERASGRTRLRVIEPPVDLTENRPDASVDVVGFRRRHGIPDGLHLVVVSRLADELKLEGLLTAIRHAPGLRPDVVLTIVGDGPARAKVETAAAQANREAGRTAVVLTGEVTDPRPAYAMADIALGMGGSALRAMAFGAPLVVQGEQGFWSLLTPESMPAFRWTGWYGTGTGVLDGPGRFVEAVRPLLDDVELREQLGRFALHTVSREFALTRAAGLQEEVYRVSLASAHEPVSGAGVGVTREDVRGAGRFLAYKTGRWRARLTRGRRDVDDFNAHPVAGRSDRAPADNPADAPGAVTTHERPLVVYAAGVAWDGIEGTDHRLVGELVRHRPVLWVDPPRPVTRRLRPRPGVVEPAPGLHRVAPDLWRLHVVTTPGVTRPGLRSVAEWHVERAVAAACERLGHTTRLGVVAHPDVSIGSLPVSASVLLMTDDFEAGAALLGVDAARVRVRRRENVADADVVLAVSPTLAERLGGPSERIRLFPNGCTPEAPVAPRGAPVEPVGAVVVGQLNERLDIELLGEVVDRGVLLLLVGPRYEQDREVAAALDRLLRRDGVTWVGRQPYAAVRPLVDSAVVGLTPYVDTEFNRASFPLKTLEYLASGLRVVSTNLPASRWLGTPMVDVAATRAEFVERVVERVAEGRRPTTEAACREVAGRHTWQARSDELHAILATLTAPPTRSLTTPTGAVARPLERSAS